MKGWYRTTFADGSSEVGQAENATEAKTAAKNARIAKVDPGRNMQKADLTKHDQVKVTEVTELTAEELEQHQAAAAATASPAPSGSTNY